MLGWHSHWRRVLACYLPPCCLQRCIGVVVFFLVLERLWATRTGNKKVIIYFEASDRCNRFSSEANMFRNVVSVWTDSYLSDPYQHLPKSRVNSRALARMSPGPPGPLTSLEFQDLTDRSPVEKLELGQPGISRVRNQSKRA